MLAVADALSGTPSSTRLSGRFTGIESRRSSGSPIGFGDVTVAPAGVLVPRYGPNTPPGESGTGCRHGATGSR
jgi:hypothetical protein